MFEFHQNLWQTSFIPDKVRVNYYCLISSAYANSVEYIHPGKIWIISQIYWRKAKKEKIECIYKDEYRKPNFPGEMREEG